MVLVHEQDVSVAIVNVPYLASCIENSLELLSVFSWTLLLSELESFIFVDPLLLHDFFHESSPNFIRRDSGVGPRLLWQGIHVLHK